MTDDTILQLQVFLFALIPCLIWVYAISRVTRKHFATHKKTEAKDGYIERVTPLKVVDEKTRNEEIKHHYDAIFNALGLYFKVMAALLAGVGCVILHTEADKLLYKEKALLAAAAVLIFGIQYVFCFSAYYHLKSKIERWSEEDYSSYLCWPETWAIVGSFTFACAFVYKIQLMINVF